MQKGKLFNFEGGGFKYNLEKNRIERNSKSGDLHTGTGQMIEKGVFVCHM